MKDANLEALLEAQMDVRHCLSEYMRQTLNGSPEWSRTLKSAETAERLARLLRSQVQQIVEEMRKVGPACKCGRVTTERTSTGNAFCRPCGRIFAYDENATARYVADRLSGLVSDQGQKA